MTEKPGMNTKKMTNQRYLSTCSLNFNLQSAVFANKYTVLSSIQITAGHQILIMKSPVGTSQQSMHVWKLGDQNYRWKV